MARFYSHIIATACIVLFIVLSVFSSAGFNWHQLKYSGEAITGDELTYIPSGYYYLKTGRMFFNIEHPPLIKDIAALPLLFLKPHLPSIVEGVDEEVFKKITFPFSENILFPRRFELENSQWRWGTLFLFTAHNNPDSILFWSRLAITFFNALLLGGLYYSLIKVWNQRSALFALFLVTLSPVVLAFGPLVILDLTAALLQLLAIVWFACFLEAFVSNTNNKKIAFFWATSFIFLANMTKATSLLLLPILFGGGIIWLVYKKLFVKNITMYALYCVAMILLLGVSTMFYYFAHTHNMQSFEVEHQLNAFLKDIAFPGKHVLAVLNNFHSWSRAMVEYVLMVLLNLRRAHFAIQKTYFFGTLYRTEGPGLLYYPILLFTKIQLPVLLLGILVLAYSAKTFLTKSHQYFVSIREAIFKNSFSFLLLSYSVLYFLFSWFSHLQMGIRYVLIVVLVLLLSIARCFDVWWDTRLWGKVFFKHVYIVGAILILFSTLHTFPYFLSYYNSLAGGTQNGHFIAVDSNYDWGGQDLKHLAQWVKDNNIAELYTDIVGTVPEYYLGGVYKKYSLDKRILPPPGSYVVISAHVYRMNTVTKETGLFLQHYFPLNQRIATIGTTMFIFRAPMSASSTLF